MDSFLALVRARPRTKGAKLELQDVLQRLAMSLASRQVTAVLIGTWEGLADTTDPVVSMADGIVWLRQSFESETAARTLQVLKLRGQQARPGPHPLRLGDDGVRVFPRTPYPAAGMSRPQDARRAQFGMAELDAMLGGGIPATDAALVAGPSGTGKSLLATQFITHGGQQGEPGVLAVFDEHPGTLIARADAFGLGLQGLIDRQAVAVIDARPRGRSLDEVLVEMHAAARQLHAQRVVIDSLTGFELGLGPAPTVGIYDALYRLVGSLTGAGLTLLLTANVLEPVERMRLAALMDDVLLLRRVEVAGSVRYLLAVIKMRSSAHSADLRPYSIRECGLVVDAPRASPCDVDVDLIGVSAAQIDD